MILFYSEIEEIESSADEEDQEESEVESEVEAEANDD